MANTTRRDAYRRAQQLLLWAAQRVGMFEELFFMDTDGNVVRLHHREPDQGQRLGLNQFFTEGLKQPRRAAFATGSCSGR